MFSPLTVYTFIVHFYYLYKSQSEALSASRMELTVYSGGPGGAVYSFIFAWTGTACSFVVISELASMAPTSGGQYHWCAMLAPPKYMKILSYLTGA